MRKTIFLTKLAREQKLQAVEPSEEIKQAYLQRSNESLSSAKALIKIGNLKDSVALAYYSMYHCLTAALFQIGIKCENHTGSIMLLKEVFQVDNKTILKAKSERVDKQYYVDFEVNLQEAEQSIRTAENFIADLTDLIATMSEKQISDYNKTARSMFT